MNYSSITQYRNSDNIQCVLLKDVKNFCPSDIFDCGQCFRYFSGGTQDYTFIAYNKCVRVYKTGNDVNFENVSEKEFLSVWANYFTLDIDYSEIKETFANDKTVSMAYEKCSGIRILRQDGFECLISFIISQNNNIPRIKKIINSLCENFGEKFIYDNEKAVHFSNEKAVHFSNEKAVHFSNDKAVHFSNEKAVYFSNEAYYSFPTPEKLAKISIDELSVIKSGFRAKYISDAAQKVASGEICLAKIPAMQTDEAADYLMRIKGVGPKVASCVLLFGFGKFEVFPVDVWVKKILAKYYPVDFNPYLTFGKYAGIAQQYLFHYERSLSLGSKQK